MTPTRAPARALLPHERAVEKIHDLVEAGLDGEEILVLCDTFEQTRWLRDRAIDAVQDHLADDPEAIAEPRAAGIRITRDAINFPKPDPHFRASTMKHAKPGVIVFASARAPHVALVGRNPDRILLGGAMGELWEELLIHLAHGTTLESAP